MSKPIIFSVQNLYGYIDNEQPSNLTGWICGKYEIVSVFIIMKKANKKIELSYGHERKDVKDLYPTFPNSLRTGFYGNILNEKLDFENEILFEVDLKDGRKMYSDPVNFEAIKVLRQVEHMTNFIHDDVPLAKNISHGKWINFLVRKYNKKNMDILEVGSRDVIGGSLRKFFSDANYTGFDYYEGDNVDIVGDAHKLSTYFPRKKFDLIFSNVVFEHLAMPWVVSSEIAKLLKLGGCVFIETHYSYSSHSRPWHFFQFSENALKVLFNPMMGIECIEAGVSNPICGFFSGKAESYLKYQLVTGLYCHADFFGKKTKEVDNFNWNNCDLNEIVNRTLYPRPGELKTKSAFLKAKAKDIFFNIKSVARQKARLSHRLLHYFKIR